MRNPAVLFRGTRSRIPLQFATQGVPMILNSSKARGVENPITPPPSAVALWMTTLGVILEPVNLSKPAQDKFLSLSGIKIDPKSRLPAMTAATAPFILARNQFYAHAVFGNKGKPLEDRMIYAAFAGAVSNVLDVGVNVAAYEAAIAKDGTPLKEIFNNIWKSFAGAPDQQPYQRFVNFSKKSLSGIGMRVAGVAGATAILSPELTGKLEVGFEQFSDNIRKMWNQFQEQVAAKGGVDENSIKKDQPSTSVLEAKASPTKDAEVKKSK